MRKERIEQIKTFLQNTPNFRDRLEEIHLEAIVSGATEDEFKAALNDVTSKNPYQPTETVKPYMKKMIAFDAAIHVFFLVIAVGAISIVTTLITSKTFPTLLSKANEPKQFVTKQAPENLVTQVYANGAEIDGSKVFSYPGSSVTLSITGTPKREVFGFLPYWMLPEAQRINLTGITTVSFFGLEMDGGGNIVTRYDDGETDQGWEMWNSKSIDSAIRSLRSRNIKTQVTLKAFNAQNIEQLVSSDQAQRTFIANAVHMVNSKGLDGLNIDFEYVGTPPKGTDQNFTRLMANLNAELKRQVPDATLSVATYVNAASYPGFFDIEALEPHVDAFVIMGYDFHTPKGSPGPIAPMEGEGMSLKGFMQSYLEKVAPEKIILALAHYGYDWPINEHGNAKGYAGMLSYAEIAAESSKNVLYWDEVAQTPFYQYIDPVTNETRVVHFENTRSLGIKYDYINEKNLKGVGIWALGYDGVNNDLRSVLLEKFTN